MREKAANVQRKPSQKPGDLLLKIALKKLQKSRQGAKAFRTVLTRTMNCERVFLH